MFIYQVSESAAFAGTNGELYLKTGMFLHGVGGYYYGRKSVNEEQNSAGLYGAKLNSAVLIIRIIFTGTGQRVFQVWPGARES
ncbi:hypothetical protein CS542_02170 [Pedobacter sp. IW39]|nr:hypothetical protein CS542_02170 [Pedobacter sp. IW39]